MLSDEFFLEVTQHSIPADLEAAKALSSAPVALDLYMSISYRCFTAKHIERVPIFGPYGLAISLVAQTTRGLGNSANGWSAG